MTDHGASIFDATAPSTQAFGDSAAAGSATVAAHRDHKHGMPVALLDLWIGPTDPRDARITAGAWPTANKAWYFAFTVHQAVTVSKGVYSVSSSSGNIDLGIYDAGGTRLASTGSTAMGGAFSQPQVAFSGAATVALVPGVKYWAAIAIDNNTAQIHSRFSYGAGEADLVGNVVKSEASAFPLPSTASFSTGATITPYVEFIA